MSTSLSVRHKAFAPEAHPTFGGGESADLFGGNKVKLSDKCKPFDRAAGWFSLDFARDGSPFDTLHLLRANTEPSRMYSRDGEPVELEGW